MIYKILNDNSISWKAKGIFFAIATSPSDFTAEKLTSMSTDGRSSVRNGVNELIEKGYIERKYTSDGISGVHLKLVVKEK